MIIEGKTRTRCAVGAPNDDDSGEPETGTDPKTRVPLIGSIIDRLVLVMLKLSIPTR